MQNYASSKYAIFIASAEGYVKCWRFKLAECSAIYKTKKKKGEREGYAVILWKWTSPGLPVQAMFVTCPDMMPVCLDTLSTCFEKFRPSRVFWIACLPLYTPRLFIHFVCLHVYTLRVADETGFLSAQTCSPVSGRVTRGIRAILFFRPIGFSVWRLDCSSSRTNCSSGC